MKRISRRLVAAGLALGLAAVAVPGFAGTVKTYSVDCSKGQSINAALAKNGDELIIEITGMCQERVIITRNRVTLRGTDPDVDGIQGVVDGEALVEVWNADNAPSVFGDRTSVYLENLGIRGDDTLGLVNYDSSLTLTNCRITGHGSTGFHISGSGYVTATDSEFSDNVGTGVNVQRNGRFLCERCLFEDNDLALRAQLSGDAFLLDSTIGGPNGISAANQGRVQAETTDVTAAGLALLASDGGQLLWSMGTVSGAIAARRDAFLRLFDVVQIANPSVNRLYFDSSAQIFGGTLLGIDLSLFSNAEISAAEIGDLTCSSGADAQCDGTETKSSSTCGLCP